MSQDLHNSHLILAQLKNAMLLGENSKEHIERILKKNCNVNSRVSSTAYLELKEPDSIGCTALHLAYIMNNIEAFKILLNSGADYEIKNKNGSTILHNIVENSWENNLTLRVQNPYAKQILSAHVESNNFSNPCNTHGISHFHAACLTANIEAVEFFLKNGISADQSIGKESPNFPGDTALHFAVRSHSFETVQLLLNHNANSSLKNAVGMTPLFMLLEQKIKLLNSKEADAMVPLNSMPVVLQEHEKILYRLLKDKNAYSGNLYPFHLVCCMKDLSVITRYIEQIGINVNRTIDRDSPPFSGYTGLHFAALCNLDTVITLLKEDAPIEAMSTDGTTPFDICLEKYNVKEMHKILSAVKSWKDITLSDNKTKLLDLIFAMQSAKQLDEFLKSSAVDRRLTIPIKSLLWPGFTILHLAVLLCSSDLELIGSILPSSNVVAQDVHGQTALNLAYRRGKSDVVYLLLTTYQFNNIVLNPMDEDSLSHLHITCAEGNAYLVEKLLLSNFGISLAYSGQNLYPTMRNGFTPLHIAEATGNSMIIGMLIRKGADPYAADSDGLTPIHWILSRNDPHTDELSVINPRIIERVVNGLSHLHIASYVGDKLTVENLLMEGSNVNAAIKHLPDKSPPFLERYAGYTPLHQALQMNNTKVVFVLVKAVKAGADIFLKNPFDDSTPFYDVLDGKYEDQLVHFLGVFRRNKKMTRVLEKKIGLTLLHVACRERDLSSVIQQLALNAKVNAKIHADSPIWPGCTPLHVLMMKCANPEWQNTSTVREIIGLLLHYGLDVGIANSEGNTVVHLAHDSLKNVLLRKTRSYKFNPVNYQGLSHFNIACLTSNVVAVGKFIMKRGGADVNRQVDFFSDKRPGCSTLHLLMSVENVEKRSLIVDLILSQGARVDVEDSAGRTVLHLAAGSAFVDVDVMKKIIDAGVDINATDIYGKTALEILLSIRNFSLEKLKLFINHKCNINAFNPITESGYLPMILANSNRRNLMNTLFEALLNFLHNDELGRTVVHNIVSTSVLRLCSDEYANLIKDLANLVVCSIDAQDKKGRTALHLAAKFTNREAVAALLKNGAEFNIDDSDGKTAFSWSMNIITPGSSDEPLYENILKEFVEHTRLLEFLNIYVSPVNKSCADDLFKLIHESDLKSKESYSRELEVAKSIKVRMGSWTVYDFLSETGLVVAYAYMTLSEQKYINQFVVSCNYKLFPKLESVIKLQYQKALNRRRLIEPAIDSLIKLIGITFSRFCCENILRFLANAELENLINDSSASINNYNS